MTRIEIAARILAAMHTDFAHYSRWDVRWEHYALAQADALIKLCPESEPNTCEHKQKQELYVYPVNDVYNKLTPMKTICLDCDRVLK